MVAAPPKPSRQLTIRIIAGTNTSAITAISLNGASTCGSPLRMVSATAAAHAKAGRIPPSSRIPPMALNGRT